MENIVGKGESACNKQFLLFSQCFLLYMTLFFIFNALLNVVCNLFHFGPVLNFVGWHWLKGKILPREGACERPHFLSKKYIISNQIIIS